MTRAILKVLLTTLVLVLPEASSARASDPPRDGKTIVVDDGGSIFSFDNDDDGDGDDGGPRVLATRSHARGGFLGVHLIDITQDLRAHFGAPRDAGVLVAEVETGSPAAKAGIEVGDVITRVDADKVESSRDVARAIGRRRSGDSVKIEVERGKSAKTLTASVEERRSEEFEPEGPRGSLRDFSWPGRDFQIRLPRIESAEKLDHLREKLHDLEKRLDDLEKKLR